MFSQCLIDRRDQFTSFSPLSAFICVFRNPSFTFRARRSGRLIPGRPLAHFACLALPLFFRPFPSSHRCPHLVVCFAEYVLFPRKA